VLVLAATVVLMAFAPQILQLWLGVPDTVARTHRLVTVLAAGTAMNGLMHIPYALQLASGWTTLTMVTNALALCLLVPATILLAREFGPIGAAWVWVALNAGYILIQVPIMHRRLLVGEQWRWYGIDVALPLAAAGACAGVWRIFLAPGTGPVRIAGYLAAVSAATLLCAALATPATRELVQRSVERWPGRLPSSGGTL
jgi:O-antigen/teichoic acid export membrane protein